MKKVDSAAWEGPRLANHAMRLLTLRLFKHLHGLSENSALYALEDDKLFE